MPLNYTLKHGFKREILCYVCFTTIKQFLMLKNFWDFSSSPVVKTSSFHCRRYSFDPCWGIKIPHAEQYGQTTITTKKEFLPINRHHKEIKIWTWGKYICKIYNGQWNSIWNIYIYLKKLLQINKKKLKPPKLFGKRQQKISEFMPRLSSVIGKWKLKQHWDTIAYPHFGKSWSLVTSDVGKDMGLLAFGTADGSRDYFQPF